MKRDKTALFAAVAAVVFTTAAPAHASTAQESIFQDDAVLAGDDPNVRARALDELNALGVDTVRALVLWNRIAPSPTSSTRPAGFDATNPNAYPAGNWARFDQLVRGAQQRGMQVLLTPTGPGPGWASDCRGSYGTRRICRPNPNEFGAFVTAVGRRYPTVRRWSIWNEPNQAGWLTPQMSGTSKGPRPEAPHRYRLLAQSATAGLQAAGHGGDQILLGETAPVGRTTGALSKRSLAPVVFWRELFCLSSKGKRLTGSEAKVRRCTSPKRFAVTGAAHHPYTKSAGRAPTDRGGRYDMPIASIGRLNLWLDRGARHGWLPRRGLPVYSTEFGFQTNPPDKYSGVSPSRQAEYLNRAEYMSWRNGRVRSSAQYELFDEPDVGAFQTGLRYRSGKAKPSYAAYRLPIWAFKRGSYKYVWGMVRPAGDRQQATVQHYDAKRRTWRTTRTVAVGPGQRFVYLKTEKNAKYFRLTWNGHTSRKAVPR
jgi:hypothetical protein